jgi:hypothetical protein
MGFDDNYKDITISGAAPGDGEKSHIQLAELLLYDKDGKNIPLINRIVMDENTYHYDEKTGYYGLREGYIGFGKTSGAVFNGSLAAGNWRTFANLFGGQNLQMTYNGARGSGVRIDDEKTWIPIVFRLPADVKDEVAKIDFVSAISLKNEDGTLADYRGRGITAFRFDGSVDGINWDTLLDTNNLVHASNGYYYSSPDVKYGKSGALGFQLEKSKDTTKHHDWAFTGVGAANGGILEVMGETYTASRLVIDAAASAGIISNVILAADGVINVENVESMDFEALELPGDFSYISGYENLSGWELEINGESCSSKIVTRVDGTLTLRNRGLKVIIR